MFLQEQAVEFAEAKEETAPHLRHRRHGCNWRQQQQLSALCAARDSSEAYGMHLLLWKLPISEALIRARLNFPSKSLNVLTFWTWRIKRSSVPGKFCRWEDRARCLPNINWYFSSIFLLKWQLKEHIIWKLGSGNFMDLLSNIFLVYYMVKL